MDQALSLERAGHDVIHLEKGELDFDTPEVIKESAIRAIRDGRTRYTASPGLPELREAICDHYLRAYGLRLAPAQIVVNSGSSPAMLALFLAILSAGDEVILSNPGYRPYETCVRLAGARPVYVDTGRAAFAYTAAAAAEQVSASTRAIVINFPANPVGSVADRQALEEFAGLGPLVVSDEVYHGLTFDGARHPSILELTDEAVVANSFSKAFAMTGWRLGYLILPERLAPAVTALQQDCFISPNAFVQWAGIAALTHAEPILAAWRDELRRRRDCLLNGLGQLGFDVPCPPRGAFYVFARLPADGQSSAEFAADLLRTAHVAVTPGSEFGPDGEGYVRFSYAAPCDRLEEAIDRMNRFLAAGTAGIGGRRV
jgi:aspartate/methionine/tyrosine aminotransferase